MHKGPRGTEAVESGHVVTVGTLRTRRPGEGGVQGDFDHIVPVVSPALNTQSGSHHAPDTKAYVAYSIMPMNSGKDYKARETEVAQPLMAAGPVGGNQGGDFIAFQPTADCLTAAYGTKWNGNASATNGSLFAGSEATVRRLTPTECERLQGFPDNFTAIPWRKKGAEDCPDGPRYKALGNSMAVPVMRWIGERIQMVDALVTLM